jgi:hypothetical protein
MGQPALAGTNLRLPYMEIIFNIVVIDVYAASSVSDQGS